MVHLTAARSDLPLSLDELDALIDACQAPAIIVLSPADAKSALGDQRAKSWVRSADEEVSMYRGLPVWIEVAGRSRLLNRAQLETERLRYRANSESDLTAPRRPTIT